MTEYARSVWFTRWFARQAEARLRRTFGCVRIAGLEHLRNAITTAPVLVIANHTSWWDPLLALWLCDRVQGEAYALMDARNLARLPFFGLVGAFGVDLESPRDGARAIRRAAGLLDREGRVVWIFPEGRERSPHEPLALLPGAAAVARLAGRALVVPIALRYVFGGSERPDVWVAIGEPTADARDVARQTIALEHTRASIDAALRGEAAEGFITVLEAPPARLARLAERMLVLLTRLLGRPATLADHQRRSARRRSPAAERKRESDEQCDIRKQHLRSGGDGAER